MATTPNYSWVMPAPTDFVTDLPADFEIFGDAVDATVDGIDNRVTDLEVITTEGDLIVGDASGDPVRVPVGTVGQVLASDGDTVEWVTPAAGGAYTLLASGSLVGASPLNLTSISTAYKDLYLVLLGYAPTTNTRALDIRLNNDSGTNYLTKSIFGDSEGANNYTGTEFGATGGASNTATTQQVQIFIPEYANGAIRKIVEIKSNLTQTSATNGNVINSYKMCYYKDVTAITQINLIAAGGFDAGDYALYGVK